MQTFVIWADAHPNLASWAQGVGTFLAAAIALIAAVIAYRGATSQASAALRQADAITAVAERERTEKQRATAAAVWAELYDVSLRLKIMLRGLRGSTPKTISLLPTTRLSTEIYDHDPSVIANLPSADLVWSTAQIYKTIKNLDDSIAGAKELHLPDPEERFRARFETWIDALIVQLDLVLPQLAAAAHVSDAALAAIQAALSKAALGDD